MIRLNSVDLPAPFGPMMLVIEPVSMLNDTIRDGLQAAEVLRQVFHSQDRVVHAAGAERALGVVPGAGSGP